jgi:hypothetical protein
LTRKKLSDGRWPLERVPGKLCGDFCDIGLANKWITLRVLALGY